jgi:diacylglycerol kinase (ATP)
MAHEAAVSGVDLVIAIGGDGTVREVAGVLATARTATPARSAAAGPALFAVPGGTGNSGYRMLWGARTWDDALRNVLTGADVKLRGMDLARLTGPRALVLLGASVGLFAEALIEAKSVPLQGWARYAEALDTTAGRLKPFPVIVRVDGTVIFEGDTALVNVGGGRFRAGQYRLLPDSIYDDGLLDLVVYDAGMPTEEVLERTRASEPLRSREVVYARGQRIRIERLDGLPLCYEYDGEVQPRGSRSLGVEVVAHALPMWAPDGEGLTQ